MLHFVGILTPSATAPGPNAPQKPFFGPEWRLSRKERVAAMLEGKWPENDTEADEPDQEAPRFVSLLSPPFL